MQKATANIADLYTLVVPAGTWAAIVDNCVLWLPAMSLMRAVQVVKCLAIVLVGMAG